MFLQFIWKSLQWNWTLHLIKGKPANFNFKAIGSAQIFVQFIIIRKCLQWHWKRIRAYVEENILLQNLCKCANICTVYYYKMFTATLEKHQGVCRGMPSADSFKQMFLQFIWTHRTVTGFLDCKRIRACVEECRRLILFPWLPQAPLIGNYYPQFSILNENIIIPNDDYDDSQWKDDCRQHL